MSGLVGLGWENTRLCTDEGRVGAMSARFGKVLVLRGFDRLLTRSKSKREKVRWVALQPSHGSPRPAMPVASGVFRLPDMHFAGWVADKAVGKVGGL